MLRKMRILATQQAGYIFGVIPATTGIRAQGCRIRSDMKVLNREGR